jgi:hypothetical protein
MESGAVCRSSLHERLQNAAQQAHYKPVDADRGLDDSPVPTIRINHPAPPIVPSEAYQTIGCSVTRPKFVRLLIAVSDT